MRYTDPIGTLQVEVLNPLTKNRKTQEGQLVNLTYGKYFLVVILITFVVYVRVLGQKYVGFDDNWYIFESPFVAGFEWSKLGAILTQPYKGQYSPLPQIYLAGLYKAGGGDPFLMKLFALLTHAFNSFLVFRLVGKLAKDYRGGLAVAALFALHPIQVESVAWLTAIFKISACFSLVAMLAYIKFLDTRKLKYYLSIPVLMGLSFLTKEQSVLLPLSLVLIDFLRGRNLLSRQVIVEKAPLFALSLLLGILTLRIASTGSITVAPDDTILWHKLYLISVSLLLYVQKLVIPIGFSILYVPPIFTGGVEVHQVVLPIVVLAGLVATIVGIRRNRTALFGLLFWLSNMSLSFLFILLTLRDAFIADRYVYLASVGFFLFGYSVVSRIVQTQLSLKKWVRPAVVVYLAILAVLTFRQVGTFDNTESLWSGAIRQNPGNYMAYVNRGQYYQGTGDHEKAIRDYLKAIEANPHFHMAYYYLGTSFFETGQMLDALSYTDMAIEAYDRTRRASNEERVFVDALNNRAAINTSLEDYDKALQDLQSVLEARPRHPDARYNRALVLYHLRRFNESLSDIEALIAMNSATPWALNLGGLCHMQLGDTPQAIEFYNQAISLDQQQALFWLNRSYAYEQVGNLKKALSDARNAQRRGARVDPAYLSRLSNDLYRR